MSIDATLFVTFISAIIVADFIRAGINTGIQYIAWKRSRKNDKNDFEELVNRLQRYRDEESTKTEESAF